jgi:hypothetical protein
MRVIHVGSYLPYSYSYFDFKQVHHNETHLITRLDTRRLEDIESKVVRKIVRTVYRNKDDYNYILYYREVLTWNNK